MNAFDNRTDMTFENRLVNILDHRPGVLCFFIVSLLTVYVRAELPQFQVNHAPYLQLGDAALGDANDQMEIWWQTIPAGSGNADTFEVLYRQAGFSTWKDAALNRVIDTGVEGRINHSATISDLLYDTEYEYRVNHVRATQSIGSFQNVFKTRQPPGDPSPFTFVSYGDSAFWYDIENFRSVQNQINQLDETAGVAFSLPLGDNAYWYGMHSDFDARFDPILSPENAHFIASHIEYTAIGNHEVWDTPWAQPFQDNYSFPLNGPLTGEYPEHNFSFDYGDVHFTTFSSNSFTNPRRLENQLDWLVEDLQASDAQWKIVFAHHPIAGAPDKNESPADDYYQQVVSRLREAKADLFLVGHSHTYNRTYPLLGASNSQAIFLEEADDDFIKGIGLIQLTSGVGGKSLRSGSFEQFPFTAAGFTASTSPRSDFGFTQIDVTERQLTLSYIGADEGQVIDSFTITDDLEQQVFWDASTVQANWSEPGSWAPANVPGVESIVTVDNTQFNTTMDSVVDADVSVDLAFVRGSLASTVLHIPVGVTFETTRGLVLDDGGSLMSEAKIVGRLNNIAGQLMIGTQTMETRLPVPEPCAIGLLCLGIAGGLAACRSSGVSRCG